MCVSAQELTKKKHNLAAWDSQLAELQVLLIACGRVIERRGRAEEKD
jgi:hypothetical protein